MQKVEADKPEMSAKIPPKLRDLSNTRYGRTKAEIAGLTPDEEDVIPAIGRKHPIFLLITSFGFASLYAELLFFGATYYGNQLSVTTNLALIAVGFLVTFATVYFSYVLPHRRYQSRFHQYSPIIFLIAEWTMAILLLLAMSGFDLALAILLVNGSLEAVGEMLRSIFLYGMVAILLYHGLIVYVRYVRFLYEREMHESYKIVSFAGVISVIVMIVTLYLLQFDLGRMGGSGPNQGWLALHLTLRDVGLLAMTFYIIVWHGTVLADH